VSAWLGARLERETESADQTRTWALGHWDDKPVEFVDSDHRAHARGQLSGVRVCLGACPVAKLARAPVPLDPTIHLCVELGRKHRLAKRNVRDTKEAKRCEIACEVVGEGGRFAAV
jgi:hypothetical protein